MATACERLDELVKDYLLFRGFTTTVKAFDHEVKLDKDKGLRADKIVEQLVAYVGSHDLQRLRDYWGHLNQRFFSRLEQRYASSVRKLEVSLLKLYVVNAYQNNRQDRVRDFFEKIGPELQNQLEFRDWFAFQFLPNPAENGNFYAYFTRQWQETVQLSLHNFLQVILQAMPYPALLNFENDSKRIQQLQEENEHLKNQLKFGSTQDKKPHRKKTSEQTSIPQPLPDLIYDFSGLADSSIDTGPETGSDQRQKTTRRFPINLSAPLLKRNRQPPPPQPTTSHHQDVPPTGGGGNYQQHANLGNQCHNNSTVESHPHPVSHSQSGGSGAPPPVSAAPWQGAVSSTTSASSGIGAGAQKSNTNRAVVPADLHGSAVVAVSQQTSSVDGAVLAAGASRKKGPREMTSFPPYNSPVAEKSDPLPVKASNLAAAAGDRQSQQGQGQREKSATVSEPAAGEDVPGTRESSAPAFDYGPVEQLVEGKQCPFLVLSDDEYLEHQSAVCYSRFSLSGQHIASLDVDGIVKVWTWSPQPCTTATVMSRAPFLSLDWASKSDRWLLLGNQSGQIRLFDTREIKTFREASVESPHLRVTYLSTCPSTMTFASCLSPTASDPAIEAGKLAVWDLKTMKMERYLPIDPAPVAMTCCVHNHNGKLLLAGSADGVVRLYDLSQRQCVKSWKVSQAPVQTIQFAQQEASFFTMGRQGVLQEWSLMQTSGPVRQIKMSDGTAAPVSQQAGTQGGDSLPSGQLFSLNRDKSYLLCGMQRRGAICKVDESSTKGSIQKILDLSSHSDAVTTVDWSPSIDTPVCVTGAKDGRLKVATLLFQ